MVKSIKSQMKNETKVITGRVRFSYVNVFEPYGIGESKKYSVSLIIPKEDTETIKNIKIAIENANKEGIAKGKFQGKKVKDIYSILHDGDIDRPTDEVYANSYYINANSNSQPSILDINTRKKLIDSTEFYSGCYGCASINLYPYNYNNTIGIACGLNNILKIEDGECLSGKSSAESDFNELIDKSESDFDEAIDELLG